MDDKPMIPQTDRRKFLKQASLSVAAISSMPSMDLPVLGADLGSRIQSLEMLVLRQAGEQRRVLKVISSSGLSGYADFPDLDYAPALGGVARNELIGVNPFAVEAIWARAQAAHEGRKPKRRRRRLCSVAIEQKRCVPRASSAAALPHWIKRMCKSSPTHWTEY